MIVIFNYTQGAKGLCAVEARKVYYNGTFVDIRHAGSMSHQVHPAKGWKREEVEEHLASQLKALRMVIDLRPLQKSKKRTRTK